MSGVSSGSFSSSLMVICCPLDFASMSFSFHLKAKTPSRISAPIQNLLERLPAMASINGYFD